MRYLNWIVAQALLIFCLSFSNAQVNFGDLPECTTFTAANCSLTDPTCQCQDKELSKATSHCMLSNCTLADSIALGKLQESVCGFKPQSKQHALLSVNLATSALAIFAILLRLTSRCLISKRIWSDDIVICVVGVLVLPFCGLGTWMILNGLGTHTWDNSAAMVTKIFQLYWIDETFYILTLMLTKVSLLLFYLRIFPSRGFQLAGKSMIGFVVASGIVILLCQLFQCLPVQFNWDKSIRGAKCLNVNALTYAHASINIIQDVLILALPIPWILRLKLQLNQKIGLLIMFQVGAFACITAMVRLRSLAVFGGTNSTDPLWENADTTMWTAAEVNTAIICSCLPAIRALYKTGRKVVTEHSSKRKSITIPSVRGGKGAFSATSKSSRTHASEIYVEHSLDLTEEWVPKNEMDDDRHGPAMITQREVWSSGKGTYMSDVREEPELELQSSHSSSDGIVVQRPQLLGPHAL